MRPGRPSRRRRGPSRNYGARLGAAVPSCGAPLEPIPTTESKPIRPTSIYAIGKRDHEEMCLVGGRAYGIPTTALRFFNVYGPRQALSNPYTGVAAIFSSRLLSGKRAGDLRGRPAERATSSTSPTSLRRSWLALDSERGGRRGG